MVRGMAFDGKSGKKAGGCFGGRDQVAVWDFAKEQQPSEASAQERCMVDFGGWQANEYFGRIWTVALGRMYEGDRWASSTIATMLVSKALAAPFTALFISLFVSPSPRNDHGP